MRIDRSWILIGLVIFLVIVSVSIGRREEPLSYQPTATAEPTATNEPSTVATEAYPPANPYLPEHFYTENGFLRYETAPHLVGMDVSEYQQNIDWQAVADSGIEFVIIRAGFRGSSVGSLHEDEQFRYHLENAKEAGLQVGVYFFSQALNPEEAEEEANYACDLLDGAALDLPLFFDWEYLDGRLGTIDTANLTNCAIRFCQTVEARGYQGGVYFNQTYGKYYFDLRALQEYTLWLAEYNPTPGFPYAFDCLQYTDAGTVPGVAGPVDLDILWLP